jgi:integrator complex subunit 2
MLTYQIFRFLQLPSATMDINAAVNQRVFKAVQELDVDALSLCSPSEIRPVLPTLARISLLPPLDSSKKCADERIKILAALSGIEAVNSIVAWLSIDFHALEVDVKREQQIRFAINIALLRANLVILL